MKQKISIRFQTFNKESFQIFKKSLEDFALTQKLSFSSINLPIQKKIYTILKSPHVNKKAKDQFELRFYNGLIVLTVYSLSDYFLQQIKKYFHEDLIIKVSLSNQKC